MAVQNDKRLGATYFPSEEIHYVIKSKSLQIHERHTEIFRLDESKLPHQGTYSVAVHS